MTIGLRFSTRSDVGLVRANNQDSAFAGEQLLLVADGMGGHAGGDVASALCIASISPLNNEEFTTADMLERLGDAVERARIDLVKEARAHIALAGMGTTVTGLLLCENKLAMAHMGDSRAYLLRDGKLSQVTNDHTFVQHLVDTGKITPEEAETHPQRSVVMRVLGDFELDLIPDLSIREARPGDRWLLCSDGLSGFVRFETIEQTLRDVADLELCSEYLIQLALRGGGSDNVTCVVADVFDSENDAGNTTDREQIVATAVGSVAYGDNIPEALDASGVGSDSAQLLRGAHERVNEVISQAIARKSGHFESHNPQPETGSLGAVDGPGHAEDAEPLSGKAAPVNDDDLPANEASGTNATGSDAHAAPQKSRARRTGRALLNTFLTLVVVSGAGYGAYTWGSNQYFLGVNDGKIAIFNGFPQSIGPVHLSSVVETSDLDAHDLEPFATKQLFSTIRASSLTNAHDRVSEFGQEIADKAEQARLAEEKRLADEAAAKAAAEKEAAEKEAAEKAAREAAEKKAVENAAADAKKSKGATKDSNAKSATEADSGGN